MIIVQKKPNIPHPMHGICTLTPRCRMSKPSSLWFRKQTGFWYTTIQGVQHKLSHDKVEARKMLHKLLADDKPPPGRSGISLRKLCDNYLVRTREQKEEHSHKVQLSNLKVFCETFGHRDPATLKVHEVEEWLGRMDTWADSTQALFITIIKAVFNWAEQQQYLAQNPIKKLKRRSTGRRRRVLTPDEGERIKAEVSEGFRDFLTSLELTGCRPFSEAARITARDIDWEKGRAMLIKHKTAKKTGRPRLIYFPPSLLARLHELAERYPEGPLLRNRLGQPWTADTAGKYLKRVCRKLGIEGVTSYTIRHSFISSALVKGVPVETVAVLAGNTPKTIWSNYDQVDRMHEALQAAAIKAVG
jgi:integrase